MATKILVKKSVTGGAAPVASDLDAAELAVNLVDRKLYTKDNSGAIVTIDGAYVDSVAPGNPAEGDLWYDTANNLLKAHNGSAFVSAGYQNLSDLEDVTITSIASGEVLKWNGSAFVNNTLSEAGIAAASHNHSASNITSGTLANARISSSSVTQHEDDLTITASQVSDFDTEVSNNSSVTANTAKVSNVSTNLGYNTAASSGTVTSSDGNNATIPAATTSLAGLMTAADKGTLNSALQSESDTLSTVTGRGSTTSTAISITNTTNSTSTSTGALKVSGGVGVAKNLYVGGNTTITGNLTVEGTTTSVNSTEVNIGDAIILLNSEEAGTPSINAGFEVERGTAANKSFIWNEANDAWDLSNEELQNVTLDGGSY